MKRQIKRLVYIFLAALLISLLVQTYIWRTINFVDQGVWITRTENLAHDLTDGVWPIALETAAGQPRYGGHPGTSFLLPASLVHLTGTSPYKSLRGVIIVVNSLLIAGIFTITKILRPESLWWITAGIIALVFPLNFYATPTNVVITTSTALLTLLSLAFFERSIAPGKNWLALYGLLIGLATATRLPFGITISVLLLFFLEHQIKFKRLLFILLVAAISHIILNPLLWFSPITFTRYAILRTASHVAAKASYDIPLTFGHFALYTPFTIISLLLVATLLFVVAVKNKRTTAQQLLPAHLKFILVYLLITFGLGSIFYTASFKTLRYFFPFIIIWDMFLPLTLLHLAKTFKLSFAHNNALAANVIQVSISALVAVAYTLMLIYNLFPPGPQGLI